MKKQTKKNELASSLVRRTDISTVKKALIQNGHAGKFSEKPNVAGRQQAKKENKEI